MKDATLFNLKIIIFTGIKSQYKYIGVLIKGMHLPIEGRHVLCLHFQLFASLIFSLFLLLSHLHLEHLELHLCNRHVSYYEFPKKLKTDFKTATSSL